MSRLSYSEFRFIGEGLNNGETVNVFHCKSGIGNDRLYITKTNRGVILAFCHHCGKKGYYKNSLGIEDVILEVEKEFTNQPKNIILKTLSLPADCEYEVEKWSIAGQSWVNKYGITKVELMDNGIGESSFLKRLVIPILDGESLLGYQTRKLFESDQGPKYLTYKKVNENLFMLHKASKSMESKTCILVEDKLSAIKCSRFIDSIWLLGTNVGTNLYNFLSRTYDNVIIFLDNDNQQVKNKQIKIHRILSNLMKNKVSMCYGDKDPKEYRHLELQRKITECLI